MNKSVVIGIVVVILVGGGIIWYMQSQNSTSNPNATASQNLTAQTKGKVVLSITDDTAPLQNISSVQMTVSQVELHSATQGWITISNQVQQFDLLKLKATNKLEVAATADIAVDTYNQIRLKVDKVIVIQSGVAKEAKLPSGQLTLNGNVKVEDGLVASVKLDFLVDKSLHLTGKGEFIFTPVIKMENRSHANVRVDADGSVKIDGGTIDIDTDEGMDLDGEMKEHFILKTDTNLEIEGDTVKLMGSRTPKPKSSQ